MIKLKLRLGAVVWHVVSGLTDDGKGLLEVASFEDS